ncbi:MAG: hypothetical protein HYY16_07170 [Planctomycetes bacterium]|nr:hypothetical protein [Planctomycetota bacterium]
MPIPEFLKNGALPRGTHQASLAEARRILGRGTARREALMLALQELVSHARRGGVRRLLVDGSFVTAKKEPRDIDAVISVDQAFMARAARGDRHTTWLMDRAKEERPKLIDLYVAVDNEEWDAWVRFFEHDLWFDNKGLVEVQL